MPNSKLCPRWEREADKQSPVSKDVAEHLRDLCLSIFGQLLHIPQLDSILQMATTRPRGVRGLIRSHTARIQTHRLTPHVLLATVANGLHLIQTHYVGDADAKYRGASMSGWVTIHSPRACGPMWDMAPSSSSPGHGNPGCVSFNPYRFPSQEGTFSMRQRGVCPGFGGSDLEKEYESGWGGLPASSAQAVGAGCQAARLPLRLKALFLLPLSQKLGETVCASSIQSGTFTPSYHLLREGPHPVSLASQ